MNSESVVKSLTEVIKAPISFIQSLHEQLNFHDRALPWKQYCAILAVLAQMALCLNINAASGLSVPQQPAIMGDFAKVIRFADGHIDTATMISRIQTANMKTYLYLIGGSTSVIDWEDFCDGFMPAAQTAGIDVFVYLMPPSEGGPHAPYADYTEWSQAIATQATAYSRLKGIVMDDFTRDTAYFTPSLVGDMMNAAHAIYPRLSFHIIAYFFSETNAAIVNPSKFLFDYADRIDGVIFPYMDLDSTDNLNSEISSVAEIINDTSGYYAGYYSISFPASTQSAIGAYGGIRQTITWPAGKSEYKISFYHFGGNIGVYTLPGYHIKRVKIDDAAVWSADAAVQNQSQYGKVELDITSSLAGKSSAVLSFELYEQLKVYNYPVSFNLKKLAGTNVTVHDFSEAAYWTAYESMAPFTEQYIPAVFPQNGSGPLPLTIMIYCTGTTWNNFTPPGHEYITSALDITDKAVEDGNANGAVTYCLNKSNAVDEDYLAAKAAFFNCRDLFYRAAFWMFNDSANPALDSSIFANNGTISNASWDSDGITGGSLSFNKANNSQFGVANKTSLQLTDDLTLSMWIKPGNLVYRQNLLDKCYYGEYSLTLFETTGKLYYFHGVSSSNYFTFTALDAGIIQTDAWQHIAVTRDAVTRTVKSYYNGTPQKISTYSVGQLPTASASMVKIGNGYVGGFTGKIDQPVIYSRVLSGGEIFRQYFDRYCHGSWSFDGNCGLTALDQSFYAGNGTLSNVSWDGGDSKAGSSLIFNRTSNSQVSISNSAALQLTGDLTLSMWIKPDNLTYRQNPLDKCYYGEYSLTLFETTGKLYYFHGVSSGNFFTFNALDAGIIQPGVWQHIVITRYAATRTVKSYYNGTQQKTSTYPAGQLPTATSSLVKIGNGYAGGVTGKIDEVKIYNKALTDTEVASLYNSY